MRIDIVTLFPAMFAGPFDESIVARASKAGIVEIHIHNLRDWTSDRHRTVDDKPFGGGAGMVLKAEPLFKAIEALKESSGVPLDATPSATPSAAPSEQVVLLTPQGERLEQKIVAELAQQERLILVCGHYEGVDERFREHGVDREISIGDYVLSGGELPAAVLVDAIVRLLPGALGSAESALDESHTDGLLEYPHYTRPAEFRGWRVPDVLLSGHHGEVERWRRQQALDRTKRRRPDLLEKAAATITGDSPENSEG